MSQKLNIKKGALLAMMGLVGSVSAAQLRNLGQIDPFCNTFNSDGSCQVCSYRYYKNTAGKCTQVSDLCKTWSNVNGKCLSCYVGYAGPNNGVCGNPQNGGQEPPVGGGDIDENCQCFNEDRTCNDCFDGYQLNEEGICEQIDVGVPVDPCDQYEYVDHYGKWYFKWIKGCKKVCVSCIDGYYLNADNECVQLPDNCLEADQDGNCVECQQGYTENEGVCQPDVGEPVDPCQQYGYVSKYGKLYGKWFPGCHEVCLSCIDGYYLNKYHQCQQLPEGCTQANYKGQCTECEQGFDLEDGVCQPSVGNPVTNQFCVTWNNAGDCIKCAHRTIIRNHQCYKVSDQCQTWSEITGDCQSCYMGYKLKDGECILP